MPDIILEYMERLLNFAVRYRGDDGNSDSMKKRVVLVGISVIVSVLAILLLSEHRYSKPAMAVINLCACSIGWACAYYAKNAVKYCIPKISSYLLAALGWLYGSIITVLKLWLVWNYFGVWYESVVASIAYIAVILYFGETLVYEDSEAFRKIFRHFDLGSKHKVCLIILAIVMVVVVAPIVLFSLGAQYFQIR